MNPIESEKRYFIDFIRGIAIFLMLWGHSIQCCCSNQFDFFRNAIFIIIYSFHMSLFMLISGYLFFFSAQKREISDLIEYKTKSLLYTILMCSVLNLILTNGVICVFFGEDVNLLLGKTHLTSLWFLWSVLSCGIPVAVAVKAFKNPILKIIFLFVGLLIVLIFPCGEYNGYMYPYFVIGYLYACNENKLKTNFNIFAAFSTVAFIIMLFYFKKKYYISTSGLFGGGDIVNCVEVDFFRWLIGLFGSTTMILFCEIIFPIIKNTKTAKLIRALGRNSLAVYVLSVSLLSFWLPIITDKMLELFPQINWNNHIWLYNLIITPFIAVTYSILLIMIIKIMKKAKLYKIIFGR